MVEFRSKLNSDKSRALSKNAFKKLIWLYVVLTVLLIAIGIVGVTLGEDTSDFAFGVGMIVLGIIVTPLGYVLTVVLQKSNDKSTAYISEETEEVYTLDEQFITLTQTRGDVFTSSMKARYSIIYKAYEDSGYFYLYISRLQSYVIDKSSITKGTIAEATTLLKANLGDRFKR